MTRFRLRGLGTVLFTGFLVALVTVDGFFVVVTEGFFVEVVDFLTVEVGFLEGDVAFLVGVATFLVVVAFFVGVANFLVVLAVGTGVGFLVAAPAGEAMKSAPMRVAAIIRFIISRST